MCVCVFMCVCVCVSVYAYIHMYIHTCIYIVVVYFSLLTLFYIFLNPFLTHFDDITPTADCTKPSLRFHRIKYPQLGAKWECVYVDMLLVETNAKA